jgi:hypothetical protein
MIWLYREDGRRVVKRAFRANVDRCIGRGRTELKWIDDVKPGVDKKGLNIEDASVRA